MKPFLLALMLGGFGYFAYVTLSKRQGMLAYTDEPVSAPPIGLAGGDQIQKTVGLVGAGTATAGTLAGLLSGGAGAAAAGAAAVGGGLALAELPIAALPASTVAAGMAGVTGTTAAAGSGAATSAASSPGTFLGLTASSAAILAASIGVSVYVLLKAFLNPHSTWAYTLVGDAMKASAAGDQISYQQYFSDLAANLRIAKLYPLKQGTGAPYYDRVPKLAELVSREQANFDRKMGASNPLTWSPETKKRMSALSDLHKKFVALAGGVGAEISAIVRAA